MAALDADLDGLLLICGEETVDRFGLDMKITLGIEDMRGGLGKGHIRKVPLCVVRPIGED